VDIDLLKNVSKADTDFLNKMFNRRHILVHNARRVDQEYLHRTGDSSVRFHEKIVVRSRSPPRDPRDLWLKVINEKSERDLFGAQNRKKPDNLSHTVMRCL
jgi:hypothetical protein